MKALSALAAPAICLLAMPVAGQQDDSGADNLDGPASMRCSALADLEQAQQTTTIFYIAGYYDGHRDATTIATVGQSAETAGQSATNGEAEETGSAATAGGTEPTASVPELALEAILAACAQSPDSRIADIITAHLGSPAE